MHVQYYYQNRSVNFTSIERHTENISAHLMRSKFLPKLRK